MLAQWRSGCRRSMRVVLIALTLALGGLASLSIALFFGGSGSPAPHVYRPVEFLRFGGIAVMIVGVVIGAGAIWARLSLGVRPPRT